MSLPFLIRPEGPADLIVIADVIQEAFLEDSRSSHTEHFIIDSLRKGDVLSISLVAEINGNVVGNLAFSPVEITNGAQGWYGLGPIAVKPNFQGQGIGQALVQNGLEALKRRGAQGCVVLGEPEFYGRFGFQNKTDLVLEGVPQENFLFLAFGEELPTGHVTYHQAFQAKE